MQVEGSHVWDWTQAGSGLSQVPLWDSQRGPGKESRHRKKDLENTLGANSCHGPLRLVSIELNEHQIKNWGRRVRVWPGRVFHRQGIRKGSGWPGENGLQLRIHLQNQGIVSSLDHWNPFGSQGYCSLASSFQAYRQERQGCTKNSVQNKVSHQGHSFGHSFEGFGYHQWLRNHQLHHQS